MTNTNGVNFVRFAVDFGDVMRVFEGFVMITSVPVFVVNGLVVLDGCLRIVEAANNA